MSPTPIDLSPWLNAAVATFDGERRRGGLNAWGNSFPAEELPFGSTLEVGGVPFRLPFKAPGGADSLEPLGQSLALPGAPLAGGIALLCCGEMGEQSVALRVEAADAGRAEELVATARGSMVPAGGDPGGDGLTCSHLHYPGGYDLSLALPAAWRWAHRWRPPLAVARLVFGSNPLFHLLAATLLDGEAAGE